MLLHYFKQKENIEEKLASNIYSDIIALVKFIIKNNSNILKNEFNTSFELISIILFCVFFGSKQSKNQTITKQILMNLFISDLDKSLRTVGIGDMQIGKYVKSYVKKYYYRVKSLEKIFKNDEKDDFISYAQKLSIYSNIENKENNEKISIYLFINLSLLIATLQKKQLKQGLFNNFYI